MADVDSETEQNDVFVITKVRKIVMLFQKSPVKNDVLQVEIKEQQGKKISLSLTAE